MEESYDEVSFIMLNKKVKTGIQAKIGSRDIQEQNQKRKLKLNGFHSSDGAGC